MDLFSPLSVSHCNFFYLVSIISFVFFVVAVFSGLMKKNKNWQVYMLAVVSPLVSYYIYRLFYSMCQGSLR